MPSRPRSEDIVQRICCFPQTGISGQFLLILPRCKLGMGRVKGLWNPGAENGMETTQK